MPDVALIRTVTGLNGFESSGQNPVESGKVHHVGEAYCQEYQDERAESEDVVTELGFKYEGLPAITDMLKARNSEAPLAHEEWGDNFPILSQKMR